MLSALVLAAGMGSRIREIAGDLPKPLTPFGGAPILFHNLRWLARAGVRRAFINLHYRGEAIRQAVGDGAAFGLEVVYLEESELLGTAGALGGLGAAFSSAMLVVYGDNVARFSLERLVERHRQSAAEVTLALFDQGVNLNTGIAGGRVTLGSEGRVSGFVEGAASASRLVNAGVYVVEPSVMDLVPPARLVDFGREVFPAMLAAGRPLAGHVVEPEGFCLGLDTPHAYAAGAALLESGRLSL